MNISLDSIIQSNNFHLFSSDPNLKLASTTLSKKSISILNKLISNSGSYFDLYLLGYVYLLYFGSNPLDLEGHPALTTAQTTNSLYLLCQKLEGSSLATKLINYLIEIIRLFDPERQMEVFTSISKDSYSLGNSVYFMFKPAKTDEKTLRTLDLNGLNDYLINSYTWEEQMQKLKYSFDFFGALLTSKQATNPVFYKSLHCFLDKIIPTVFFQLNLDKFDYFFPLESSKDENLHVLSPAKLLTNYKDNNIYNWFRNNQWIIDLIFPIIDFLIEKIVSNREISQHEMKIDIIKFLNSLLIDRLWSIFPEKEQLIIEKLTKIFTEIEKENLNSCQIEAAFYLYKRVKNKEFLTKFPSIEVAYLALSKQEKKYCKLSEISDLVHLKSIPLQFCIIAGAIFERTIDIFKENSILIIFIDCKQYDIDFSIEQLSNFNQNNNENKIYFKQTRINFQNKHNVFCIKQPGLYKLRFSNNYSWFNSKLISLWIRILENNDKTPIFDLYSYKNIIEGKELTLKRKNSLLKTKESWSNMHTDYRLYIFIRPKIVEFKAIWKEKIYDSSIDYVNYDELFIKERLLDVIKKAFSCDISSFFENKTLGILIIYDNEERNNKKICDFLTSDFNIKIEESSVTVEKLIIPLILEQIDIKNRLETSSVLALSTIGENEKKKLILVSLNDLKTNLCDLKFNHNDKIMTINEILHNDINLLENLTFIAIVNVLLLRNFSIKKIIINVNELFEIGIGEVLKKKIGNYLGTLANEIKGIDFSIVNIKISLESISKLK